MSEPFTEEQQNDSSGTRLLPRGRLK